jgi:low temperature requirement protein LtrA
LPRRLQVIPVHTEHLIERVGLLTIIMLGESVSSLSTGLANISWTVERLLMILPTNRGHSDLSNG